MQFSSRGTGKPSSGSGFNHEIPSAGDDFDCISSQLGMGFFSSDRIYPAKPVPKIKHAVKHNKNTELLISNSIHGFPDFRNQDNTNTQEKKIMKTKRGAMLHSWTTVLRSRFHCPCQTNTLLSIFNRPLAKGGAIADMIMAPWQRDDVQMCQFSMPQRMHVACVCAMCV